MQSMDTSEFDSGWILEVAAEAVELDPYLRSHPEIIEFLKARLPQTTPLFKRTYPDFPEKISFYFVDPASANKPGSQWQFKKNITIYGKADFIFDILSDDRIGRVEITRRLR